MPPAVTLALSILALVAQTVSGLIFALAGAIKLTQRQQFASLVERFRVLPKRASRKFAAALPPVELGLGLSILAQFGQPWPEIAGAILLMVFAVAVAINLARGENQLNCGCFGMSQTISWRLVLRNLSLALVLVALGTYRAVSAGSALQ